MLIVECIVTCLLFGIVIAGTTLKNPTMWLQEYAPAVQERFLQTHPYYQPRGKQEKKVPLAAVKVLVCVLFTAILTAFVMLAGARGFQQGALYCYTIWYVVNVFDTVVLDILIFEHWKKCRLPGTEDMDAEYKTNTSKSLKDGVTGCLIGIPVAAVVGLAVQLFT